MGDDLVTFLRARLDEDERTATDDGRRRGDEWTAMEPVPRSNVIAEIMVRGTPVPLCRTDAAMAVHIARHDPAWVLRDVEAKRQVLGLLAVAERHLAETRRTAPEYRLVAAAEAPRDALLLAVQFLAMPYADHPDYRPEWKP